MGQKEAIKLVKHFSEEKIQIQETTILLFFACGGLGKSVLLGAIIVSSSF